MTYVVLGAGLQGPALAYALSVLKPDEAIWLVEKDPARMKRAKWLLETKLECENISFMQIQEELPVLAFFENIEDLTVVSTLPYEMNLAIATQCVKKGWSYFDLGGHIQTSKAIATLAPLTDPFNYSGTVMTDIGLAPGLVNILGENAALKTEDAHTLRMFCGGLPVDPKINNLRYGLVFSPEGLINEYFNSCEVLSDGEIVNSDPMGNVEIVVIDGVPYESFNTSGGAHTTLETMKEAGLRNCSYQTLRFPGHVQILKFLKDDVGMTNEQLVGLFNDKIERITQDFVIIAIKVIGDSGEYVESHVINHDEHFTAMQRATSFSAAAIIHSLEGTGLKTYRDVSAEKVLETLDGGLIDGLC